MEPRLSRRLAPALRRVLSGGRRSRSYSTARRSGRTPVGTDGSRRCAVVGRGCTGSTTCTSTMFVANPDLCDCDGFDDPEVVKTARSVWDAEQAKQSARQSEHAVPVTSSLQPTSPKLLDGVPRRPLKFTSLEGRIGRRCRWAWGNVDNHAFGRVAAGELTLSAGMPSVGKSTDGQRPDGRADTRNIARGVLRNPTCGGHRRDGGIVRLHDRPDDSRQLAPTWGSCSSASRRNRTKRGVSLPEDLGLFEELIVDHSAVWALLDSADSLWICVEL